MKKKCKTCFFCFTPWLCVVALIFLSCLSAQAATIGAAWVYSENRQYSPLFSNPPNAGNPFHFMQAGAEVADRVAGTPPPVADLSAFEAPFTPAPYELPFMGNIAGRQDVVSDIFRDSSLGGSHLSPDGWEGKSYTFTLYEDDSKTTVSDTLIIDRSSTDFLALPIPVATVAANGDPLHPTISWNEVSGATHYRVLVMNLNCRDGREVFFNPVHISDLLDTNSYTIPAEVALFSSGRTYAIWVQATQVTESSPDPATIVNRSSYFTLYSAYLDGLPSDDLQGANGWGEFKDPDTGWITTSIGANLIDFDAASSAAGVDYYWLWSRSVPGLRGMAATITVDEVPAGDVGIGIQKNIGQLENGNIIRAEFRQQFYYDSTFFSYQVREYRDNNDGSNTELRRIATGTIGYWEINEEYTLGLALMGSDIVFFARGVNGFCGSFAVTIEEDFEPWSSSARLVNWVYQEGGDAAHVSAQIKDVKLIMSGDLPVQDDVCDINDDGQTGLAEAIHALRISAGMP